MNIPRGVLCRVIVLVGLFVLAGCATETMPEGNVLELHEGEALRKIVQMDAQRHPIYSQYDGPAVTLCAGVDRVTVTKQSPSITAETDWARLILLQEFQRQDGVFFNYVKLFFDHHGLLDPDLLKEGKVVMITLTPEGRLVCIQPVNSPEPVRLVQ